MLALGLDCLGCALLVSCSVVFGLVFRYFG